MVLMLCNFSMGAIHIAHFSLPFRSDVPSRRIVLHASLYMSTSFARFRSVHLPRWTYQYVFMCRAPALSVSIYKFIYIYVTIVISFSIFLSMPPVVSISFCPSRPISFSVSQYTVALLSISISPSCYPYLSPSSLSPRVFIALVIASSPSVTIALAPCHPFSLSISSLYTSIRR